jgi:glycosyltransferase involved in cell wall biosynthesis
MPVYNERECLRAAVEEIKHNILDRVTNANLIAIDDGSSDGSGSLLDELAQADSRIHVIHQSNRGHGGALLIGLGSTQSEYVFLVDSDRQIPLESFSSLWDAVQSGRRAAVGVRRNRHDARHRIALTMLIRRMIHLLFRIHVHDANIPFKLIHRTDWLNARTLIPEDTLAPSLFLALFIQLQRLDVAEIDVPHRDRMTGRVSMRGFRMAMFCTRAFIQLLRFRRRYRMTYGDRGGRS